MSDAFKKYELNLKVDGNDTDISPSSYSFVIRDSIFELYPKASFTINDPTGSFNEFLGFVNGTKLEISIGRSLDNMVSCPFRVVNNAVPEQYSQNSPSGKIELSLIHDYYYYQTKLSMAFNNNISDIVLKKVKNYKFNSINIDDTLNSGLWYQPYIYDDEFIIKYLLPFAYSTDSEKTPFFCYIDGNNNFNFRSYKKLAQQNFYKEFNYRSIGQLNSLLENTIISTNFYQERVDSYRSSLHKILGYYDSNGSYITANREALIVDYPKNDIDPIAIKCDLNNITSVENLINDDIILDENKNNRYGEEFNKIKKGLFIDKIVLTTNFDNKITAGKKIRLTIPLITEDSNNEFSLRNSGDYIIESTYHKWTGKDAISVIICSRQSLKLTSQYRNLNLIVNR